MNHRVLIGIHLVLGALLAPSASAQVSWNGPAQEPERGIPVRRISDVGTVERVTIALTHAWIPGSLVMTPLYAYSNALACDDHPGLDAGLRKHDGSAAIVVSQANGANRAFYYKTVEKAISAAKSAGWCGGSTDLTWQLATTRPLASDTFEELERYLSREVERIEEQLRLHDRTVPATPRSPLPSAPADSVIGIDERGRLP